MNKMILYIFIGVCSSPIGPWLFFSSFDSREKMVIEKNEENQEKETGGGVLSSSAVKNKKCGMCHTEKYVTIKKWATNVECESCHGQGKDHMEAVIELPADLPEKEFREKVKQTIRSFNIENPGTAGFHDYIKLRSKEEENLILQFVKEKEKEFFAWKKEKEEMKKEN